MSVRFAVRSAGHSNRPTHGTLLCATLGSLLVHLWAVFWCISGGGGKCFTTKILEATSKKGTARFPHVAYRLPYVLSGLSLLASLLVSLSSGVSSGLSSGVQLD